MPAFIFRILCFLGIASSLVAAEAKKPNILWLIAEDFGPHLGCWGTKEVFTPNIDKLASEGVRYTRFYTGMVCSVSRSSFMTGMHAPSIGAHNHRTIDKKPLPEGVRVLTAWMRDAGYFTGNLVDLPESCGFKGSGKTDWNFLFEGPAFDTSKWDDLKSHGPFFAQINFKETHRDYKGPSRADPAKVEIPPYYPDHPVTRKDWAEYLDDASEMDRKIGLILEALKKDGLADDTIIAFFGDNGQSHVRGKQFCYEEGLNVPLVIHWPKNFPAPENFKPGTADDRLLHAVDLAPTMLDIAGAPKPPKMQGHVFLGPRTEPPQKYVFGYRNRCDMTVMNLRSVRDERYRYIHNFMPQVPFLAANQYKETQYPVWNLIKELHAQGKLTPEQDVLAQPAMPAEELYDLTTDPFEMHNLAASTKPGHQEALKRLSGVLDQWMIEINDQGRTPESPEALARFNKSYLEGKKKGKGQGKGKKAKAEESK